MAYTVQRKDRFYVVAYDGLDPITGKERRRWHPVGHDRDEADALAARLDADHVNAAPSRGGPVRYGNFLTSTWLPLKRRHLRATTAVRYSWFVDHYIRPALGDIPLRRLRPDHLDALYADLSLRGGRTGTGLAPKTINDVHVVIRSSLGLAVRRQLIETNIALAADARHRRATTSVARAWTAQELAAFLAVAHPLRLYPALHLTAYTGMRRGEVAGLKWSDLDRTHHRLSITRNDPERRRQARRVRRQDPHQQALPRPRRQDREGSRQLAAPALPRRAAPRARRLDVPQHGWPVHQPGVPQPALCPDLTAHALGAAHPFPRSPSHACVAPGDGGCADQGRE